MLEKNEKMNNTSYICQRSEATSQITSLKTGEINRQTKRTTTYCSRSSQAETATRTSSRAGKPELWLGLQRQIGHGGKF